MIMWDAETVLEYCHEQWEDYEFSLVGKSGHSCQVTTHCKIHGESVFSFRGASKQGIPCRKCRVNHNIPSNEEWVTKAHVKHNHKYEYLSEYDKGDAGKITFKCPQHGVIEMTRKGHLKSETGCPKCSKDCQNFSRSKGLISWKVLNRDRELANKSYIVYLGTSETYNKVGITTEKGFKKRTTELKRYSELVSFNIIYHGTLEECFELEQFILQESETFNPANSFGGHTECFKNNHRSNIL